MRQRIGQVCVVLVSSLLLMALLQGCAGAGDDEHRFTGTWQGTTSQGTNVSLVIANDQTSTTVTAEAHITGEGCTAAALVLANAFATGQSIVGNRLSVMISVPIILIFPPPVGITGATITGTFANESTLSGEIQFTANLAPSPCAGSATVTFQTRKQ